MALSSRQQGFTLIEILIVVIILGVLASVAVFTLGDSSSHRELERQSRELFLIFQVAGERALLDNTEIGVQIVDNEVHFLSYVPEDRTWQLIIRKPFSTRVWPEELTIEVETETDPPRMPTGEEEKKRPDLVFFSSGESTPFRLWLGTVEDPDHAYLIETDGLNAIELREPNEESEVLLE